MNPFEKYLVELLQGKIHVDNKCIEVRKHFQNAPELPTITLDLNPGVETNYSFHEITEKDTIYFHRTSMININIWCNTEEERESITEQILQCYYKEKSYDYTYCSNYSNGSCRTQGSCLVPTVTNRFTVKNKCPNPEAYGYESLQLKHHIVEDTVKIDPPYDLDEDDKHPPLLRSIMKAKADYYEPVIKSGITTEEIVFGDIYSN